MPKTRMKNLHVPLPESLYQRLRLEAERSELPATDLAREAIDHWLAERQRMVVREAIQEYASKVAGTPEDLDEDLEAAAIERLRSAVPPLDDEP
jgi:hypothetical protein